MSARQWKAKDVLLSDDFNKAAAYLAFELRNAGLDFCLVGGLAVGVYANPPVTVDIDLLLKCSTDDLEEFRHSLKGFMSHALRFGGRLKGMPKYGVKFTQDKPLHCDADLIVAGDDKFLQSVVRRAITANVSPHLSLPVITVEDLVVMKSLVGRDKDLEDVQALQAACPKMDMTYVGRMLERLL